jgi:N-acetylglutamate synthase
VVSLQRVGTAPKARGQRLAESVIRKLFAEAEGKGAAYGLLSVEEENASARRLYERLGFQERYRYWYRVRSID